MQTLPTQPGAPCAWEQWDGGLWYLQQRKNMHHLSMQPSSCNQPSISASLNCWSCLKDRHQVFLLQHIAFQLEFHMKYSKDPTGFLFY